MGKKAEKAESTGKETQRKSKRGTRAKPDEPSSDIKASDTNEKGRGKPKRQSTKDTDVNPSRTVKDVHESKKSKNAGAVPDEHRAVKTQGHTSTKDTNGDAKGKVKKERNNTRKRKVAELTPSNSPRSSPLPKSKKLSDTPESRKRSTTSTKTSPYFKSEKTASPSKVCSPLKSPLSKPTMPVKQEVHSDDHDQTLSQSPFKLKPDHSNEEQMAMMKKYMADKVTEGGDGSSEESSDDDDWEEVAEMPHFSEPLPEKKEEMPAVQVVVEAPDPLGLKKKKKKNSAEELFARQWNKFMRELRLDMHKAHLLCLLAYGLQRNRLCSSPPLQALALSTVPPDYLELRASMARKKTGLGRVFVNKVLRWFVTVFSIDPYVKKEVITEKVLERRFESKKVADRSELLYLILLILRVMLVDCRLCINLLPISKKVPGKTTTKTALRQSKKSDEEKKKGAKDEKTPAKPKNSSRRKRASKVVVGGSSDEEDGKTSKKKVKKESIEISSDESDFEPSPPPAKSAKKSNAKSNKIKSSDSDDSVIVTKAKVNERGVDEWLEVYIDQDQQWFAVDCTEPKFDCTKRIEKMASKPIIYVLALDNNNHVKDVTSRYNSQFSTEARKLRVEDDWWSDTLLSYSPPVTGQSNRENAQLQADVLKRPFPSKLDEFKNHPLYALERHLKKFEAIYPRTAVPMGFVKNKDKEPIYARECVKELHSRNNWLKEARLVRIDEQPYKIVKARKNFRKPTLPGENDKLDLFGIWQTEEYMPPIAHGGKVPTNEYGNVDMYRPSMLPVGCVHLRLPGLNKIAKKLGKNVAPAMTGWDQHGGWPHPILDGFIVCEEDQDVLITAWDDDQEAQKAKDRAKREHKIWDNWKLLIKGVLIRERLKKRFDLTEKSESSSGKPTKADPAISFVALREESSDYAAQRDMTNLFPFEKHN